MYRADVLLAAEKAGVLVLCSGLVAIVIFIFAASVAATTMREDESAGRVAGASFVFGLIGIVVGITMAASRSPAVGNVLPAAISFIGAAALWVITREKGHAVTVGAAVASFTLLLFTGTVIGAFERDRSLAQAAAADQDRFRLMQEADLELAVNAYRRSLGLPPLEFVRAAEKASDTQNE